MNTFVIGFLDTIKKSVKRISKNLLTKPKKHTQVLKEFYVWKLIDEYLKSSQQNIF